MVFFKNVEFIEVTLMHTYVECCLLINELHGSMVHGKWSNATHSYYTPKIAFVKSYDAFFLLFFSWIRHPFSARRGPR